VRERGKRGEGKRGEASSVFCSTAGQPPPLPPFPLPSFSSGCVYRICRQPNLLGEAIFWAGTAAAGAPALAASPLLALVAAAGVAAIVSILVGDSAKKTEDQGRRMAGVAGWRAYARTTPPLWPLPRSGPA
jgi:steroid 5-alpha reductase family enzyme